MISIHIRIWLFYYRCASNLSERRLEKKRKQPPNRFLRDSIRWFYDDWSLVYTGIERIPYIVVLAVARVAIGMRQWRCLQTGPERAPLTISRLLYITALFLSLLALTSMPVARRWHAGWQRKYNVTLPRLPMATPHRHLSLLWGSLKGLGALFRPAIHGRRFLWAIWKMRLAYYLSPSFSTFLLGELCGEAMYKAPQYFGTPRGRPRSHSELCASLYEFVQS